MALQSENVIVAGTGGIYVAPEGTALPAALAALAAPWVELGYVGDEGVTFGISRDVEDVLAWQSAEPVRRLVTAEPKTIGFELLEFGTPDTVKLALRGGVISVATGVATLTPAAAGGSDIRAMVIEAEDDGSTWRFCYQAVELSGDVEWGLTKSDATRLPLEFAVLAGGWKIVTDHPDWVAAPGGPMGQPVSAEALIGSVSTATDVELDVMAGDERRTVAKAAKAEQEARAKARA